MAKNWSENLKHIEFVKDAMSYLSKFPDHGVLVDIGKDGKGYFPKFKPMGHGTLKGWVVDYDHLSPWSNYDVKDVDVILVDTSESEGFERNYIPDERRPGKPVREKGSSNLPPYALTVAQAKEILSKFPPDAALVKKIGGKYNSQEGDFLMSASLSHYNNSSYKFVAPDGTIVTDGLTSDETPGFTFIGKGRREGMYYTFEPGKSEEHDEEMINEIKNNFKRLL